MEHVVHRETVAWTVKPSDVIAVSEAFRGPLFILEILPEPGLSAPHVSEFGDTPSAARALLIGYDEV